LEEFSTRGFLGLKNSLTGFVQWVGHADQIEDLPLDKNPKSFRFFAQRL